MRSFLALFTIVGLATPAHCQSDIYRVLYTNTFMASMTSVGDVNNDNVPDFAVGETDFANNRTNTGYVRIYSGRDCQLLRTINAPAGGNYAFGHTIDGHGNNNVAILSHTWIGSSAVYVYSAKDGKLIRSWAGGSRVIWPGGAVVLDGDYLFVLEVGSKQERYISVKQVSTGKVLGDVKGGTDATFGVRALVSLGDLNKDGVPEFAVGAWAGRNNKGVATGKVEVYSGKDQKLINTFYGDLNGHGLGVWLAAIGDVDTDGFSDLVVGAKAQYVRVYSVAKGTVLKTITSKVKSFGASVSGIGDADGDKVPDFVVAAPTPTVVGPRLPAEISAYSGKTFNRLWLRRATLTSVAFGVQMAAAGDVNGDGSGDVLIANSTMRSANHSHRYMHVTSGKFLALAATECRAPKTGGTKICFELDAGKARAGWTYWIFGSVTGTKPGIPLGRLRVPLNYDFYTELSILRPNTVIANSLGKLDANGRAVACGIVPKNIGATKGFTAWHAYVVWDGNLAPRFASNAVPLYLY